jgi:2-amino-4-hydroxy-6-hydroxymethyldihydropteridine diphosphokinase
VTESAYLGIGTNLGDRLANLQAAVDLLAASPGIRVARSSRVYETAPVGPPQPDFLNIVVEVETSLAPRELLAVAAEVESRLHRVRAERWGPRTIDVDILTFDERTIDEPELTVPHPRMHERAFVLVPLLELTAAPMLPGGGGVRDLPTGGWDGEVRLFAPPPRIP